MSLTDAQLKKLSYHFMFDINDAKKVLGLSVPKFPSVPTSKTNSTSKAKSVSSDSKRKTGYHLFMQKNKAAVKLNLQKRGEIPPRGVITELAKRWNELPKEKKEKWNTEARSV
jgi:hypothetical protein